VLAIEGIERMVLLVLHAHPGTSTGGLMKSKWSVMVVYENTEARESAVTYCDRLMERFWADFGFDVNWCAFEALQDKGDGEKAADKAAEADIMVVANATHCDLPWAVKGWLDNWLRKRGEKEGTLVGLVVAESTALAAESHAYLRVVAHRAGMDFVTGLPESISPSIPDSPDGCTSRAQQMTSVLDAILSRPGTPPSL
jgi:hypothetical protein